MIRFREIVAALWVAAAAQGVAADGSAEGGAGPDPAATASASRCIDADDLKFLHGLNSDRQYALAAYQGEIDRRANESCPSEPRIDLELAKALYQLGDFPRVRALLRPHLAEADPLYRRYYFESSLLDLGRPGAADTALAFADSPSGASWPEGERALYRSAALYVQGRAAAARAEWPASGGVAPGDASAAGAAGQGNIQVTSPEGYLRAGFKSPAAAGALSVFPGLGYAYAGQRGDGLFALALVSAFYGVAAAYAYYDSPERAWTFAGFGAVFHLSNIYGAQRAARETNRRRKIGFLSALHGRLFP